MQIAGPVVGLDVVPLHLADRRCGQIQRPRMAGDEQAEDLGHILAPLAERREGDLHRAEPVPQRIASSCDVRVGIAGRAGNDDADVEPPRLRRADGEHLALLDQRGEPCGQHRVCRLDLVKEQRPAIGAFGHPGARQARACTTGGRIAPEQ